MPVTPVDLYSEAGDDVVEGSGESQLTDQTGRSGDGLGRGPSFCTLYKVVKKFGRDNGKTDEAVGLAAAINLQVVIAERTLPKFALGVTL